MLCALIVLVACGAAMAQQEVAITV